LAASKTKQQLSSKATIIIISEYMYREGEIEKGHENQLPMFHEQLLQKESQPRNG